MENNDSVKLKPIMGIRPGVYLTVLYSVILLFILFMFLVRPGLKNMGTQVIFKTEPAGAAIRIDGTYMGTASSASGTKIFVPKGSRTIEAVLPGFTLESAVHEIPGRVFGSLFFPRRYKINITLTCPDPAAALALAAGEYAAWSFGGEPTATWQVPLVLSEGSYLIGPLAETQRRKEEINELLLASARFAVTRAALRDLIRAKMLVDNGGNAPSPVAAANSVSDILCFLSENPQSAGWLADLLPPESAKIIRDSAWYKNSAEKAGVPALKPAPTASGRKYHLAGLNFASVQITEQQGIMISETPVPKTLFLSFLNEEPEWHGGYTNYYEEEISGITEPSFITGITWYAAEAFCKWLTKQLPPQMAGEAEPSVRVRLPTEEEWAYAYEYGLIDTDPCWEWSSSPFAPLNFKANRDAILAVGSPEKSIFNGVSYNPFFNVTPKPITKASLPPDLSSPIVTFRVVITIEEEIAPNYAN